MFLKSEQITLGSINMIAKEPIEGNRLYASDHFGLSITFWESERGFEPQNTIFKTEFKTIPQDEHGYISEKNVKTLNLILTILLFLFVLWLVLAIFLFIRKIVKPKVQRYFNIL